MYTRVTEKKEENICHLVTIIFGISCMQLNARCARVTFTKVTEAKANQKNKG